MAFVSKRNLSQKRKLRTLVENPIISSIEFEETFARNVNVSLEPAFSSNHRVIGGNTYTQLPNTPRAPGMHTVPRLGTPSPRGTRKKEKEKEKKKKEVDAIAVVVMLHLFAKRLCRAYLMKGLPPCRRHCL